MEEIKKLELKLAAAKRKKEQEEWEEYLNESKSYLLSLVNKTFMKLHANGRFTMFKVVGFKEQYYIDRNGMDGSWHPSRWFELTCTKSITCSVANDLGDYFRPGIEYQDFKFIKVTGKSKNNISLSKIEYVDYLEEKYTYLDTDVRTFGKIAYKENTPLSDRSLSNFRMFLREAPEGMFEEAEKIAKENILKTKEFWKKYQPIINL